jgi:hypothetical protein
MRELLLALQGFNLNFKCSTVEQKEIKLRNELIRRSTAPIQQKIFKSLARALR